MLQELADADWGLADLGEVCARIRADPGVRLVGPITLPELEPSTLRVDVRWPVTATPWRAAVALSGRHTLYGVVEVAAVAPSTTEGCAVDLCVSRPVSAGAARLFVLAAAVL
ncbi:MAG TPA: hypothetical protein VFX60_19380 [Micromonospora sp.]|nr:hypothetical protein [Micromonospora sp.]